MIAKTQMLAQTFEGILFAMRAPRPYIVVIPLLPGIEEKEGPVLVDDLDYHIWLPCHDRSASLVIDLDRGRYEYHHPDGFTYVYLYNDQVHL